MVTIENLSDSNQTPKKEKLNALKEILPNCFDKNGEFIRENFDEILNTNGVNFSKESYSLNWLGKSYARLLANEKPLSVISEDESFNKNKNSQNLLIKGDNLEVLKHLKNAYYKSIKMIYIDPPYNTGSDFIYKDDRRFSADELSQKAGIELSEAKRILEFTQKGSNSHSAWLTFIYPRLCIARNLLRDDGVIFISIDDNEQAQLKLLCDEIFGEENFVAEIVWKKKNVVQNDAKFFSTDHENILCYTKNQAKWIPTLLQRTDEMNARYSNPDNDPRGDWTSVALQAKSGTSAYEVTFSNGVSWQPTSGTYPRLSKESIIKAYDDNRIWFGKDGKNIPRLKKFLSEVKNGISPNTVWFNEEVGSTQKAKEQLKLILKANVFDTPKPIDLLRKIIQISTNGGGGAS